MKYIITLIFLFLLLSCTGRPNIHCIESNPDSNHQSQTSDSRCDKIMAKADDEAEASGYCYVGPLLKGRDPGAIDPDPEKCKAFYKEAGKKCDALPFDPKYIETLSGSAIFKGKQPVMINGKTSLSLIFFYFIGCR